MKTIVTRTFAGDEFMNEPGMPYLFLSFLDLSWPLAVDEAKEATEEYGHSVQNPSPKGRHLARNCCCGWFDPGLSVS
jgi:hypothetical protein